MCFLHLMIPLHVRLYNESGASHVSLAAYLYGCISIKTLSSSNDKVTAFPRLRFITPILYLLQ
jgi:hypothetical protein